VEVRVETVAVDERSQSPVVVLEEREGSRRLPIWIGFSEAQSIASQLESVEAPRPNSHDLAKRLIDGLEGSVARVVVTDLAAGIYYARIVLTQAGHTVEIDARPSDAIAIALRMSAPVFVNERLFERALEASAGEEGHRI
jgi:bifunctional DNase/RNase